MRAYYCLATTTTDVRGTTTSTTGAERATRTTPTGA